MKPLEIAGVKLIAAGDRIVESVRGVGRKAKPFEPESLKVWARLCRPGATVLDIGAYTGLYSLVAASRGCRVIAFEPLPKNRSRFRANAALNGLDVEVNSEAVSDEVGSATITLNLDAHSGAGMTSGASLVKQSGKNPHQFTVRTITVDSLHLRECAAMKIDVERAEPMVLRGARKTLERLRPVLLVEVLSSNEKMALSESIEGYRVEAELDGRNWLMVPEC